MDPLDDYPIGRERDTLTAPPPRGNANRRMWGVVIVAMVIAAALMAFLVMRPSTGPGAADTDPAAPAAKRDSTARGPLGPEVEQRQLPPLDLSDPVVRELLTGLSSRPELATWLATDGLIRNFVASVDAVANGGTPAPHLRSLAPARPFAVQARGENFVIDARSYQRYDGIVSTVAELDADGLARAYATLRPRLQEAYRELGYPDGNVDSAVERAIARLLDTPLLEQQINVQATPVLYQFVDPRIERLSAAQKQLIRMGPRNQRIVQDKLRAIARALGIPT
jgi:Protein of unknown function (DUF3014)